MNRTLTAVVGFVGVLLAGCSPARVRVDCRVAADESLRERLAGPTYIIRGPDEAAESSLAFQEFARTWGAALELVRPELKPAPAGQLADLAFTLAANIVDLGTGVTSYPVYARHFGYGCGPYGPGYYRSWGYAGTQVETVHLGYDHTLFVSAWLEDQTAPGGRRVLWEGFAGYVGDEQDLASAMPLLTLALAERYGISTGGADSVRLSRGDDNVKWIRRYVQTGHRPASRPAKDED